MRPANGWLRVAAGRRTERSWPRRGFEFREHRVPRWRLPLLLLKAVPREPEGLAFRRRLAEGDFDLVDGDSALRERLAQTGEVLQQELVRRGGVRFDSGDTPLLAARNIHLQVAQLGRAEPHANFLLRMKGDGHRGRGLSEHRLMVCREVRRQELRRPRDGEVVRPGWCQSQGVGRGGGRQTRFVGR